MSFASLSPTPVAARTSLIIFIFPAASKPSSFTSNSVLAAGAAGAAASAAGEAADWAAPPPNCKPPVGMPVIPERGQVCFKANPAFARHQSCSASCNAAENTGAGTHPGASAESA